MFETNTVIKKILTEVQLAMADGTALTGYFFTAEGQRLIDVMNDQRDFLPFSHEDGTLTLIRKSVIVSITPVEQDKSANERL